MSTGPFFDFSTVVARFLPGIVPTREIIDALSDYFNANGRVQFTKATALAALAALPPEDNFKIVGLYQTLPPAFPIVLPPYPTGLPRFADSNPASDGWTTYGGYPP